MAKRKRLLGFYIPNIALMLLFLAPFVWTLSTSLKTPDKVTTIPPELMPRPFSLGYYNQLWTFDDGSFRHYFLNSTCNSTYVVIAVVAVSSLAGYGFACLDIPFKELWFVLLLAAMMIPFQSLLIPLFINMRKMGLLSTRLSLILIYTTFELPFSTFMMRNAFESVPRGMREAALLDGASETRVFRDVMLPVVWPGIVTIAIHSFYRTWNDFLIAFVFTTTEEMKTLTVGLRNLSIGPYSLDFGLLSAGSIVSCLPVMVLFAVLQRYFVAGITGGSVKQ